MIPALPWPLSVCGEEEDVSGQAGGHAASHTGLCHRGGELIFVRLLGDSLSSRWGCRPLQTIYREQDGKYSTLPALVM